MPSSPDAVVDVFVIGLTLRGSLGDAFLGEAVDAFERMRGAGAHPSAALATTVELTAAAVTRAGEVRVRCEIADDTFLRSRALDRASGTTQHFSVVAETLDGIPSIHAGRLVEVSVDTGRPDAHPIDLRVHVIEPGAVPVSHPHG